MNHYCQNWHVEFQQGGRAPAFLLCVDWQSAATAKVPWCLWNTTPQEWQECHGVQILEKARKDKQNKKENSSPCGSRPFYNKHFTLFILLPPWISSSVSFPCSSCVNKPQSSLLELQTPHGRDGFSSLPVVAWIGHALSSPYWFWHWSARTKNKNCYIWLECAGTGNWRDNPVLQSRSIPSGMKWINGILLYRRIFTTSTMVVSWQKTFWQALPRKGCQRSLLCWRLGGGFA